MKKLSIILIASVAMISCGNSYKVKQISLENMTDSLNYGLGFVNGGYLQSGMLGHDMSNEEIDEFITALDKAYEGKQVDESRAAKTGREFGQFVKSMEDKGINRNPNWRVNEKMILQGFVNGLNEDTTVINRAAAEAYITDKFEHTPAEEGVVAKAITGKCPKAVKTVALANELDSINYIFGYLNGFDINRYVLANSDDKVADQKELIENVNKGLSSNVSNPQLVNVATNFGQQLKTMNDNGLMNMPQLELNYKLLRQGLINGFLKDTVVWQSAEANTYLRQTMTSLESRQAKEDAKDRIAQEEAFLAQNAQRPEVTVTESGLQYEVLKKGKGALPKLTDVVKVHYHGTLLDGTVFDSSVERKEPISFGVTQVIPGWTEALQLMPVGSKYKLYIPYQLGYNDRPAGKIPPYSMLIFEVELLSIEKQ